MAKNPKRVIVLGGGPAALTAAYHLIIREPGKYEITVYETSWRLGGKTASGRGDSGQIEEHGMHVLFGCYHNAFDLMHDCYDRLTKECQVDETQHKFRHFFEAVEARHFGMIGDDRFEGQDHWLPWPIQFASNAGVPGDPPLPSLYSLACTVVQLVVHVLFGARALRGFQRVFAPLIGYKRRLPMKARRLPDGARERRPAAMGPLTTRCLLRVAEHVLDNGTIIGRLFERCVKLAHGVIQRTKRLNNVRLLRRGAVGTLWTVFDFAGACLKGIIKHGVLVNARRRRADPRANDPGAAWGSYDRIDRWDFREWLGLCGAAPETQASPLVRMVYDAAFSYKDGGRTNLRTGRLDGAEMGAGSLLRIMVLMAFTYKHAFYFKMRAGMGDIIAAPLFEVLRQHGVRFKFFHRLTGVKVGTDANGRPRIDEVTIDELARIRAGESYEPLRVVGSLLTWPSRPDPALIEPADYEDACNADRYLYAPRNKPTTHTLRAGEDFETVILGVPPACLPYVCADLIDEGRRIRSASPKTTDPRARWAFVEALGTTQTIALQLWFKLSLRDLGWRDSPPLLSLFYDPLNTWCDMGQTLAQEPWPDGARPRSVAYFCGPLPDEVALPSPAALRAAGAAELAKLRARFEDQREAAIAKLLDLLDQLLPNVAGTAGQTRPRFNWSVLLDPEHRTGPDRLAAQYRRVNYEPSERCTLALPGQTDTRIPAGDTGYGNLVVTGDWIRNGIHAACFEGAVQSGIRAARAVSDRPSLYPIKAEQLLNTDPSPGGGAAGQPSRPADGGRRPVPRPPSPAEERLET
jgi:uncharacterized protein with NAD-binding domain and iron-sulfur cluster